VLCLNKLGSTLGSADHEEVACFGEEADNLESGLVAADPVVDLFFGKVAVLASMFVCHWWF
jgi:hypothetical protein